jgi:KDO2-lipid IV(A) lauroyltransferase
MRRLAEALGAALGWLAWALRVRRRVVMDNLALAFPEKSLAERRSIGRATFLNLGRMAADFLLLSRRTPEEIERIFAYDEGSHERLEAAQRSGRGVVVCTAHYGNFEILAAAHTRRGVHATMITRAMGGAWFDRLWRRARARAGVEDLVVRRGETLSAAMRSMREGRVLGYVIDQNQPRHGIFPTFFGMPAATAPTPAYLALRTGAVVLLMVTMPLGDGRHRVVVEGPLEMPRTGDRARDVLAFTQDLNDRLERWVRAHPEQWYWLHRRWKTRPPGEPPGGPRPPRD